MRHPTTVPTIVNLTCMRLCFYCSYLSSVAHTAAGWRLHKVCNPCVRWTLWCTDCLAMVCSVYVQQVRSKFGTDLPNYTAAYPRRP
jgi:hypothetical protein